MAIPMITAVVMKKGHRQKVLTGAGVLKFFIQAYYKIKIYTFAIPLEFEVNAKRTDLQQVIGFT